MKVMTSAKNLEATLKRVNPRENYIEAISVTDNELIFHCANVNINMIVEVIQFSEKCDQTNNRWDWVYDTIKRVEDQPVLLEISSKGVNLIFQY